MKKVTIMTLLVFGLVIGFSGPVVLAAEQISRPKSEKKAQKEWHQALKAQAALLKARLAAEKAETYDQAQLYLEEAKGWYTRTRSRAEDASRRQVVAMEKRIDSAKLALKKKAKEARQDITDLLIRAADIAKEGE